MDITSIWRVTCGVPQLCNILGLKNRLSSSGCAVTSKTLRALRIACGTRRGSPARKLPSSTYRNIGMQKKAMNRAETIELLRRTARRPRCTAPARILDPGMRGEKGSERVRRRDDIGTRDRIGSDQIRPQG